MAEFNPEEYVAQKSGGFDPKEFVAQKGKVTVEPAPEKEEKSSILPKLGTWKDAAISAERMAIGVAKPAAALAEMVGWGDPAKQLEARDQYLKEHSGLGASLSSTAGDVAGFMLPAGGVSKTVQTVKALPKVAQMAPEIQAAMEHIPGLTKMIESPITQTMGAGAASTLLTPVGKSIGEEGYGEERLKQAGWGALLGPAAAGAGKAGAAIMSPALERIAALRAKGIDVDKLIAGDTTLGQLLGGAAQKIENWGQVLPFSGLAPKVAAGEKELKNVLQQRTDELASNVSQLAGKRQARTEAENAALMDKHNALSAAENQKLLQDISGYSTPVIARSLKVIGQDLEPGLVGSEAIKDAQKKISQGYEDELARIGKIPFTSKEKGELAKVLDPENLKKYYQMDPKHQARLETIVENLQNSIGGKRKMDAKQWQKQLQDLSDESYNLRTSMRSSTGDVHLGEAIRDLKDTWMNLLEKSAGSEKFKALNQAHSLLQAPQRAASYNKAILGGGDFKPEDLVNALRQEMPKKRFAAADDVALQDAINRFQEIGKAKAALKAQQDKRAAELGLTQKRNQFEQKQFEERLKQRGEKNVRGVKEAIGDVQSEPSSTQKRIGFLLAGAPALKALGLGGFSALSAPVIAQTAGTALVPGGLTRMLYTNQMKNLKKLATKERSPEMKAAAEKIKQNLPAIGGLGSHLMTTSPGGEEPAEEEPASNLPAYLR